MFNNLVHFVREIYSTDEFIPLHEPRFTGNEKKYLLDTIDSTFVSSVGAYVDEFEQKIMQYTGARYAIATVNGTSALHIALKMAGVESEDEVITQSLSFVATCNAIRYCNAEPLFVDVNRNTLGLSSVSLKAFLDEYCDIRDDSYCWNKISNRIVRACVPMNTFGFPAELDEIKKICGRYNIVLVEDAAESLGSTYNKQHAGTFGKLAAISFNGNKIITTGGGGMVLTNDEALALRIKHITTTAKVPHEWAFVHDETGYNYRLPNLNAALGVAQMESLPEFVKKKRELAICYQAWGAENGIEFIKELSHSRSNYWLNALLTKSKEERDLLLEYTNRRKVMTRPVWTPLHKLSMYQDCLTYNLINTEWLSERIVNVPSSVVLNG